jgi:hypothetical protein
LAGATLIRLLVGNTVEVFGREVGGIGHRAEMRHEGSVDVSDGGPINAVEELGCDEVAGTGGM